MSTILLVLVTCSDEKAACQLAAGLLREQLAACVLIDQVRSFYTWQDVLQDEPEYRLVIKSLPVHESAVRQYLEVAHPYEVPAIISWHAVANEPYALWVSEAVQNKTR